MTRPPPTPPRIRARNRAHRCFQLVGQTIMDLERRSGWKAVHGTYHGGIEHAWLEHDDGFAFDVVSLEMLLSETYYETYQAVANRRFGRKELAMAAAKSGVWGHLGLTSRQKTALRRQGRRLLSARPEGRSK